MSRPPWVIWALTDGKPGHQSQTAGLCNAIEKYALSEVHWIDCKPKHKWIRPLLRFLGPRLSSAKQRVLLNLFYAMGELPSHRPHIILSSGGNTAVAQICLAQMTGAKAIYSGTVKASLRRFIDLIVTVAPLSTDQMYANNLVLPLPPAPVTGQPDEFAWLEQNASANSPQELCRSRVGVLLVGGDGAGMTYSTADWRRLIDAMANYFPQDVEWLLTTSRRTGSVAESAMRSQLEQMPGVRIRQSVWWGEKPELVMSKFFAQGDFIICTKDSLSMVAEAVYTNKPVFIFAPSNGSDGNMTANDKEAYNSYEKSNYIYPLNEYSCTVKVEEGRQLVEDVQSTIFLAIERLVDESYKKGLRHSGS